MRFIQHYSSSKANLYVVTADNGRRLSVECGARWDKIQKALDYDLSNIEGCVLSHSHKDHSKAAKDVVKAGINLYASKATLAACGVQRRRAHAIADKTLVRLDSFEVLAFSVNHDCDGSLGFVVRERLYEHRPGWNDRPAGEYLLFVVDTSHITQRFNYPFSIVAIECAYDITVLQPRVERKEVNETYAKRLLTSHTEKQTCIRYLREFCNLLKCREIHLLHLSRDNIDAEATRKEIEDMFFIKTIICDQSRKGTDACAKTV
jgi:phosphoribosyl 1,2-cyclic phosphodiesterase